MEIDNKIIGEGLTFDDVLIVPQYSEVLPHLVKTKSRFSRNIELNVPLVSAAMDTVTESSMAIAIAQEGGIGVLHKNMSIESQSLEVRKVKRSESGMILDPITLNKSAIVGDALQIMKENKIGGIPVVDSENKLVGIVTNRDLRFEKDMGQSVLDIMTSDDIVTTELTDLENAERILQENKIEKLPVINSDNILKNPNKLIRALCKDLNIRFTKKMLSWTSGKRDSDGIWSKVWYKNVEQSYTFASFKEDKKNIPKKYMNIYNEAIKYYDEMNKYSIR